MTQVALLVILVLVNVLSGSYLWFRISRRAPEPIETIGSGLAFTFAIVPIASLFTVGRAPAITPWLVLPTAAILAGIFARGTRKLRTEFHWDVPVLVAAFLGLAFGSVLYRAHIVTAFTTNPFDYAGHHPDLLPLAQIAESMSRYGLGNAGLMSEWPVRYHVLSGLLSGTLDQSTINQPLTTLGGIIPVLSLLGIATLVPILTRSLSRNVAVPTLAAMSVIAGRYIADPSGVNINFDSTSQIASTLLLVFLTLQLVNGYQSGWSLFSGILVGLTIFSVTGTKFSAGTVAIAMTFCVLLVSFMKWRHQRRRYLLLLAFSSLAFFLPVILFMIGQNDSGTLIPQNPLTSLLVRESGVSLIAQGTLVATLLALVPSWLPALVSTVRRPRPLSLESALFIGAALAGILPLLLFANAAPNNYWFLTSATAVILPLTFAYLGNRSQGSNVGTDPLSIFLITLGSALITVLWAYAIDNSPSLFEFPQIAFIAVWIGASILVSAWYSLQRHRFSRGIVIGFVLWIGALSPIYMVGSETLILRFGPTTTDSPAGDIGSSESDGLPGIRPSIDELISIAAFIKANSDSGTEVLFDVNDFATVTLDTDTQAFISSETYARGLGPTGSDKEFDRRRALLSLWSTSPSSSSAQRLCDEGVDVVIQENGSPRANFPGVSYKEYGRWQLAILTCN